MNNIQVFKQQILFLSYFWDLDKKKYQTHYKNGDLNFSIHVDVVFVTVLFYVIIAPCITIPKKCNFYILHCLVCLRAWIINALNEMFQLSFRAFLSYEFPKKILNRFTGRFLQSRTSYFLRVSTIKKQNSNCTYAGIRW